MNVFAVAMNGLAIYLSNGQNSVLTKDYTSNREQKKSCMCVCVRASVCVLDLHSRIAHVLFMSDVLSTFGKAVLNQTDISPMFAK